MKISNLMTLGAIILLGSAFSMMNTGGIQGKVLPAGVSNTALAVLGRDTLTAIVNGGNFKFSNLKPGTYSVVIKGILPYRDTTIANIAVIEEASTDIGVITVPKQAL